MISVKQYHTFGLNAQVAQVVDINSVDQLTEYVGQTLGKDFILLGEGSNSVFLADFHKPLLLMKLKGIEVIETEDDYLVEVKAGENWHGFVQYCLEKHIFGLENLALIPGSVGACPVQNIGAYGVEIDTFIKGVEYFDLTDGSIKMLTNKECGFSYRNSIFKTKLKGSAVITSVSFNIPKKWHPIISYGELAVLDDVSPKKIYDKVIEIRTSKLPDPNLIGNSGSFFKNPIVANTQIEKLKHEYPNMPVYPWCKEESKLAAGWLIDQTGLKGYRHQTVSVHDKQALVLINHEETATSSDLVALISFIKSSVADKFGIELEPEVRMFAQNGEVKFNELDKG